jgi:hypothetical protein
MRALGISLMMEAYALAACPCYTLSSASNTHNCGVEAVPGTNPSVADWQPIFAAVASGGAGGPTLPKLQQGCAAPVDVAATFPCELLKAIAMNESGWVQFCAPTTPADEVGQSSRTIIAFDCGYGIAQVTSGMHKGEMPSFDPQMVAADSAYNLATGAQILAAKWRAVKCVGDRQPDLIEDWYTAVWAYNGLAYSNNPNNPAYPANRPVCDPNQGCPNRPYQERVFGWVEHPPSAAHWSAVALAYPNRGDIPDVSTGVQLVPNLPEPDCAGPTDCVNHRSVHASTCSASPSPSPSSSPSPGLDVDLAGSDGSHADQGASSGGCDCDVGHSTPPAIGLIFFALIALVRASKQS